MDGLVHIATGNVKLGRIPNISLVPVKDCRNCQECKRSCYALKAFRQYENVRIAWRSNSFLARSDRDEYFKQIGDYLKRTKKVHFRWHVAGDILDQSYLDSMIQIAKEHKSIKFLCFTKRHDLKYPSKLPRNFKIRLSRWIGDSVPDLGLPQAWYQDGTETRIPETAFACSGHCDSCFACWDRKEDVVLHAH